MKHETNAKPVALAILLVVLAVLLVSCRTAAPAQVERCVCEEGCQLACQEPVTTYRTVPREVVEEIVELPDDGYTVFDPKIGEPLTESRLKAAVEGFNRKPEDVLIGFRADFASRRPGTETAIWYKAGELLVFSGDMPYARAALGEPLGEDPIFAIKLVDSQIDLVVRHRHDGQDRFTVCRVIGESIGRVFDTELDGKTIEFVEKGEERGIRVTTVDRKRAVYLWDKYEGMFRVPQPAPTAPRPPAPPPGR